MQKAGTLLITLGIAILLGLIGWWYVDSQGSGSADGQTAAGSALGAAFVHTTPDRTLRSSIVAAATKLGQGRPATQGLPTTSDYSLPVLRETAAGSALMIPDGPLPASASSEEIKELPAPNGSKRVLSFDMYSWSMGTLVATLAKPTPLANSAAVRPEDVPAAVLAAAMDANYSHRAMLVVPVGASGLPAGLNPWDAYVVVADFGVSD